MANFRLWGVLFYTGSWMFWIWVVFVLDSVFCFGWVDDLFGYGSNLDSFMIPCSENCFLVGRYTQGGESRSMGLIWGFYFLICFWFIFFCSGVVFELVYWVGFWIWVCVLFFVVQFVEWAIVLGRVVGRYHFGGDSWFWSVLWGFVFGFVFRLFFFGLGVLYFGLIFCSWFFVWGLVCWAAGVHVESSTLGAWASRSCPTLRWVNAE